MNKEDYTKYYIRNSEHYLIPKDVFIELFDEMTNWKKECKQLETSITTKNNELKQLKKELWQLKTNRDEVIQLLNNAIYQNRCTCSYCNDYYLKEMKDVLERGERNND